MHTENGEARGKVGGPNLGRDSAAQQEHALQSCPWLHRAFVDWDGGPCLRMFDSCAVCLYVCMYVCMYDYILSASHGAASGRAGAPRSHPSLSAATKPAMAAPRRYRIHSHMHMSAHRERFLGVAGLILSSPCNVAASTMPLSVLRWAYVRVCVDLENGVVVSSGRAHVRICRDPFSSRRCQRR